MRRLLAGLLIDLAGHIWDVATRIDRPVAPTTVEQLLDPTTETPRAPPAPVAADDVDWGLLLSLEHPINVGVLCHCVEKHRGYATVRRDCLRCEGRGELRG